MGTAWAGSRLHKKGRLASQRPRDSEGTKIADLKARSLDLGRRSSGRLSASPIPSRVVKPCPRSTVVETLPASIVLNAGQTLDGAAPFCGRMIVIYVTYRNDYEMATGR